MSKRIENIFGDRIMFTFTDTNGKLQYGDFDSPFLNAENMRMWRRLCLCAILDKAMEADHPAVNSFKEYKAAIFGAELHIAYEAGDIIGIGVNPDNIFYPDAYNLWDLPEEDNE